MDLFENLALLGLAAKAVLDFVKKSRKSKEELTEKYNFNFRDSNAIIIMADPDIIKGIPKVFGEFGLAREDLVPVETAMALPPAEFKTMLKALKPYIEPREHSACVMAFAIVLFEDTGNWKEASKNMKKLHDKFGENGRRIYNMARSDVFQEFVYPAIVVIQDSDEVSQTDKFSLIRKTFYEMLKFNPQSVWVNDRMTEEDILGKITKRLMDKGVEFVRVYARGPDNIQRTDDVAYNFADNFPQFELSTEEYIIRDLEACKYEIKRIEDSQAESETNVVTSGKKLQDS